MSEQRDKACDAFRTVVRNRLMAYVPRDRADAEARDAVGEFLKAWGPEPRTPTRKTTKKRSTK